MTYVILIAAITLLFYAILPALGAFHARSQWKTFRQTVTRVSHYPTVTPAAVSHDRVSPVGFYRFFGTLEAIQGNDRIWITNGHFSVAADLSDVRVYLIPEAEANPADSSSRIGSSATELGSVPWSRIFSLPEGTPVLVGGAMYSEEGRGVFRNSGKTRLLVVIHDCPRESVMRRVISAGRQRNEFMNVFTLPSVGSGAILLFLLAFSLLATQQRLMALLAMTAGLAPIAPFLPPGVPLYFVYRAYWKKARHLRVQRDIVSLPLRHFPGADGDSTRSRGTLLPDLEPYIMLPGTIDPARPDTIVSDGRSIPLPPGVSRVEVDLPPRYARMAQRAPGECVVFCGYDADGEDIRLRATDDPMAGQVLVPGDPRAIASASHKAAFFYEIVSGTFIGLNVAVNVPLVYIVLALLLR